MARPNVVEKVLRAVRADPVVGAGGRVVVAVSGGPDSTALLHSLRRVATSANLELVAAHLDHGLRPSSGRDAAAVSKLAAELGVPLVSRRSRTGRSEDQARRARHAFLADVAASHEANTVALGHTADDQAETVLLHLVRGSGLEGIAGIASREGLRLHPMLEVTRAEVETYCDREGLSPVIDPTNADPAYTRNRVRAELVPLLETFNPRARQALVRLAAAARDEHGVVVAAADRLLGAGIARASFNDAPIGVRVEVLRRLWAAASGPGSPPGGSDARLRQAIKLVASPARTGMMSLGEGLYLLVESGSIQVARRGRERDRESASRTGSPNLSPNTPVLGS